MKFKKLNTNWNAEPNAPQPKITASEEGLQLSFLLNSFQFEHIDADEVGRLVFQEVYAYKLDSTNDEGYAHGDFRYKNNQLPWGEFYELTESKWESNFPADKIVLDEAVNKKELRHFIFFLKDSIFECLASDYKFHFDYSVTELLDEKYPKGYFNHYVAMFCTFFDKPTTENFKIYTDLYVQMEGKKELAGLKAELKTIQANNDSRFILKQINNFELQGFGSKQLDEMVKVIEGYKG